MEQTPLTSKLDADLLFGFVCVIALPPARKRTLNPANRGQTAAAQATARACARDSAFITHHMGVTSKMMFKTCGTAKIV